MSIALNLNDFSITTEKRLPFALFDICEIRESLKICDDQFPDESALRRSLFSATSIIEQQTGYMLGPRVVVQSFDAWPTRLYNPAVETFAHAGPSVFAPSMGSAMDIPVGCAPVWTSQEMADWLSLVDDAGSTTEKMFADCVDTELPGAIPVQITYTSGGQLRTLNEGTHFRLDHRRRPPRLRSCSCWPCVDCGTEIVVRMVCGFKNICEIENYKPEILDSIILTLSDFYDGLPTGEIIDRQFPLWNMIAFR